MNDHKGACSKDSQQNPVEKKLQPHLQPHLLSPEDLVGKGSHQTAGTCSDLNCSSGSPSSNLYETASHCHKMHGRQGNLGCQHQEGKGVSIPFWDGKCSCMGSAESGG